MIKELAYRTLESQGAFTPSRLDYITSAMVLLLELLVSAKGIPFNDVDEMITEGPLYAKRGANSQAKKDERVHRNHIALMRTLKMFEEH